MLLFALLCNAAEISAEERWVFASRNQEKGGFAHTPRGALYAAPVFGGGRGPLALVQARPVRSDAWVS